jgi:ABC-type Zn uptake system ZnuABC Zn-binding protein ZnuA
VKKLVVLLIPLVLLMMLLPACKHEAATGKDLPVVVSTITIINDMVKQVAREKVKAVSICGIGYDPHTYKSVPEDSRTIAGADLVFINGFGLEGWINKLIKAAGGNKPVITVTKGITPMQDDKGHGDPDPHCWFNASYAQIYVENILAGLIQIDPENREYYEKNADEYIAKLNELHEWTAEQIVKIPESKRILVTSHDAFRYFGRAYNIEVYALQGISTEAKAQTRDVANMVNLVKTARLPAVFIETSVNPKLLQQIASETGAKIGGTLYSDSIGNEGTEGGSYIGAFKYNVTTIVKALTGEI